MSLLACAEAQEAPPAAVIAAIALGVEAAAHTTFRTLAASPGGLAQGPSCRLANRAAAATHTGVRRKRAPSRSFSSAAMPG